MSTVGEMLREVRERRGLSLADAERETKIRQKYLAALEDDNLAALPGPLYVRGFLRNYALYLGIDPDETLEIYSTQSTPTRTKIRAARGEPLTPKGEKDPEKISIAPLSPEKIDTRVRYGTQYVAISLLAIPLIIVFYFIYSGAFAGRNGGVPLPTSGPPLPTLTPLPNSAFTVVPPTTVVVITPTNPLTTTQGTIQAGTPLPSGGTPSAVANSTPEPVPAGKVTVKIETTRDVWMRVAVDGVIEHEGTLARDTTRQWTGGRTVRIRTGRADVVKLTVNGEDRGLLLGEGTDLIVEKEWNVDGEETTIR